jgi:hypothetical protein
MEGRKEACEVQDINALWNVFDENLRKPASNRDHPLSTIRVLRIYLSQDLLLLIFLHLELSLQLSYLSVSTHYVTALCNTNCRDQ